MIQHKEDAQGRWFNFSLVEQMANIGCDVMRALNWRKKDKLAISQTAFERSLELFTLTLIDPKHKGRGALREIARAREFWIDYYTNNNEYKITDELWDRYFMHFNYAAALQRGK